MRKHDVYRIINGLVNDVNVLKDEYLVGGYINVCFNQFEEFEYLRYLDNIFKLAKKRIYLFDNEISLQIIYLLKNISSDVQVTIFTNTKNIYKKEIDLFLRKYSNVNLLFRKNIFNEKYIVIDYMENNERIIANKTLLSNNDKYYVLFECHERQYHNLFKKCEDTSVFLLK